MEKLKSIVVELQPDATDIIILSICELKEEAFITNVQYEKTRTI